MPKRVQRTRKAGQPGIPPGAVYVGRGPGTKWGNPFPANDSSVAERQIATLLFLNLLRGRDTHPLTGHVISYPSLHEIRRELAGKDLACWCKTPAAGEEDYCHGAVLLLAANDYGAPLGAAVCDRCWTWELHPHKHPRCPECGRTWDRRKLPRPENCTEWGVYCPHGQRIVERDPDHTDPEGHPVGRLVDPWPCAVDGCTLEAFEADQQADVDEYHDAINEIARTSQ
ncbi:MAG: DUF4326 domain-containing protein [Streptomyces sp.]|nr:DUF4326 domain-containing protein [Streptomyces sp.]